MEIIINNLMFNYLIDFEVELDELQNCSEKKLIKELDKKLKKKKINRNSFL